MDNEAGLNSPEQEIKDVFKTKETDKVWTAGPSLTIAEINERLAHATAETTIPLAEAQQRIQQIKAFQTHGS